MTMDVIEREGIQVIDGMGIIYIICNYIDAVDDILSDNLYYLENAMYARVFISELESHMGWMHLVREIYQYARPYDRNLRHMHDYHVQEAVISMVETGELKVWQIGDSWGPPHPGRFDMDAPMAGTAAKIREAEEAAAASVIASPSNVDQRDGAGEDRDNKAATTNREVFSGHGSYHEKDGLFVVPEGTSITLYAEHGGMITDDLGNAIEMNEDLSKVYKKTFKAGDIIPNYTLHETDSSLDIKGNPTTVTKSMTMSELIKENQGDCHWAACLAQESAPSSYKAFDIDGVIDSNKEVWLEKYPRSGVGESLLPRPFNGQTRAGTQHEDLNESATQNVGNISAPIDFDGHILSAEVKPNGNVVGGHSISTGKVHVIQGTQSEPNAQGVYCAQIEVPDPENSGQFLPKTNNGGMSTMFPDSWSADRVKVEVDAAYNNRVVTGNKWRGVTPSGVTVEGWLIPNTTVYPKY